MKNGTIVLMALLIVSCALCMPSSSDAATGIDVSDQLSSATGTVYLSGECTISRDVTVPSSATVVLMCGADDTGYQDGWNHDGPLDGTKEGSPYTVLHIPRGCTLYIWGTVLVNSVTCQPVWYCNLGITGGYAKVDLSGDIVVRDGGILDNFGIVSGPGSITAEGGSTVRDRYIIDHWRGGTNAQSCYNNGVYPMNEYHMDGISSTLVVESGASYVGTVKLYVGGTFNRVEFPQIDGDNGLIRLSDGAVATIARGTMTIEGGARFSESSLTMGGASVSTADFDFPMDGDMKLVLRNGNYVVENGFKVMPGGVVRLEGSTLTIGSGGSLSLYDYFTDETSWTATSEGPTTEYPDRDPAYMVLDSGSSVVVRGSLGGRVFLSDPGQVTFASGSETYLKTREVKDIPEGSGYRGSYKYVHHYATLVVGSPSSHLSGYWTDASLVTEWDMRTLTDGMVLYSTPSRTDVCDDAMREVSEREPTDGGSGSTPSGPMTPSDPSGPTDPDVPSDPAVPEEPSEKTLSQIISDAVAGDTVYVREDAVLDSDAVVGMGVTLVLACSEDDTGYQNGRNHDGTEGGSGYRFMTLTIPEGVTLTVEGTVLVNSVTCYAKWYCNLNFTGGYAAVELDGSIVVADGGVYDNYGITSGNGEITVKDGGILRDRYVIDHWRGGSTAVSCYQNLVYPMNEYSMKGLKCTVTMESGSELDGMVKLYVNGGYSCATFTQVGADGLIRLEDGAVLTKTVSGSVTTLTIAGGASFASSSLALNGMTVSTSEMAFPMDGDIRLVLKDGEYVVKSDYKVLPGGVVELYGARLTVSEGCDLSIYDYFRDETSWTETSEGPTTEYPQRDPAYILMDEESGTTVYGSLGGRVFLESAGQVVFADGSKTYNVTREVKGESGVKFISHYTTFIVGEDPGEYLKGYWLDSSLTEEWPAEEVVEGMVLYSTVSETAVCEDFMLEVSERTLVEVPYIPGSGHGWVLPAVIICVLALAAILVFVLRRRS